MYREHSPPAALSAAVECFWTNSTPEVGPAEHRVMPDGAIDIVFAYEGDEVVSANVVGAMTTALVVPALTTRYAGVRFLPGAAAAVLGIPACEVTDQQVPVTDLWPRINIDDLRGPMALLRGRGWLGGGAPPRDVAAAVAAIRQSRGKLKVSGLGPLLGVSRQQLARRFAETVGVAPKVFARIVRLQAVMRRAQRGAPDWSALAHGLGYADQAHLVNEFHALTGVTPTAWFHTWFQTYKTTTPPSA
jgi:AraC-like DNA-binding protein